MLFRLTLAIGYAAVVFALPTVDFDPKHYGNNVVIRDVCIIGGGSSGTYSAIRLRDFGKSVVVIEKKDRLGGHTETYTDPATGANVDYGVVYFHNNPVVTNYFGRFNIPLEVATFPPGSTTPIDFRTGQIVTNFVPPSQAALGQALGTYAAQLAQYPYLEAGFNLAYPVAPDLLLPFGDFVKKYSIGAAVNTIFSSGQGLGDFLKQSTLYVFKNFGLGVLQGFQVGFLATTKGDNSALYEAAAASLGGDVLLSSTVIAMDRGGQGPAKVLVQTPSGVQLIVAKKLIFAIPPKLRNLDHFDLSDTERDLFGQFRNSAYYTGLLRNIGIPADRMWQNVGPNSPFQLPDLPAVYSLYPSSVANLTNVKYGSPDALRDEHVRDDIIDSIQRIQKAQGYPRTTPEFAVFSSHTPFELTVSPEAIENHFYEKLYALQGQRNTFYNGAAFHTHDSSMLWAFTESLLPGIVASL